MASYIPTQCLAGFNTAAIHVGSDTFKLAPGTGTVPSTYDSANEYYGGLDFTEAAGTGYTAGGNTVTLAGASTPRGACTSTRSPPQRSLPRGRPRRSRA